MPSKQTATSAKPRASSAATSSPSFSNNTTNNKPKTSMRKTAAGARHSSAARKAPASLKASSGTARKTTTTGAARKQAPTTTTATSGKRKPIPIIKKPKWKPAPPPSMHMICYDFTIKLVRGLILGIGLGLVFALVVPWIMDTGEWIMDKYYDADLAIDWTAEQLKKQQLLLNKTATATWKKLSASTTRPPLREVADPRIQQLALFKQSFPRLNSDSRTITIVHVGHTGGRSVMSLSPTVVCNERFPKDPNQAQLCLDKQQQLQARNTNNNFDISKSSPLAHQLQHYFRLGTTNMQELQTTTTFLYTLRNPVDRILTVFMDSHPLSCANAASANANPQQQQQRPWGCETANHWYIPGTPQYQFYSHCFPQWNPEPFAQAVASPWTTNMTFGNDDNSKNNMVITSKKEQAQDCRWMARDVVSGTASATSSETNGNADGSVDGDFDGDVDDDEVAVNKARIAIAPHMYYNYEYYAQQTTMKFAGQELFVIRSEHETEDLLLLNELLGGANATATTTSSQTSLNPTPTVSAQAYGKLCCILEKEIEIYQTILLAAANLPDFAKDESMDELRNKCGLSEKRGWEDWRIECKSKLEMDLVLLTAP